MRNKMLGISVLLVALAIVGIAPALVQADVLMVKESSEPAEVGTPVTVKISETYVETSGLPYRCEGLLKGEVTNNGEAPEMEFSEVEFKDVLGPETLDHCTTPYVNMNGHNLRLTALDLPWTMKFEGNGHGTLSGEGEGGALGMKATAVLTYEGADYTGQSCSYSAPSEQVSYSYAYGYSALGFNAGSFSSDTGDLCSALLGESLSSPLQGGAYEIENIYFSY